MALPRTKKHTSPEISQTDIDFIKSSLVEMSKKHDVFETKLSDLYTAVVGNKEFEQEGMVGKLKKHDDYIEKDKIFKQRFVGATMVIGMIWSYFLKWATK